MGFIKGYDQETLRELVDPVECEERLQELEGQRSILALLEQVWLLKVLGRLDEALTLAEEAVRQARMAGTRKDLLRARILRATVLQYRGAHATADQQLAGCADEAEGRGWAAIAAFAHQHQGRSATELGDYHRARESFKRTLFLRRQAGADESTLERLLLAIEDVERRRDPVEATA